MRSRSDSRATERTWRVVDMHIVLSRRLSPSLSIAHQVEAMVASGVLRYGDALPSVREVASDLSVNRNTVALAYKRLRQRGVIDSRRGRRYSVALRDARRLYTESHVRLGNALAAIVADAVLAGLRREELVTLVTQRYNRQQEVVLKRN